VLQQHAPHVANVGERRCIMCSRLCRLLWLHMLLRCT
jgi:hypothetical protein